MQTIKTRFAPSPTGFLHIGGARTALYAYLYAKSLGGKFVLRIEDTDQERSQPHFAEDIIQSLAWLGINWDEGPYYQSQRLTIYREHKQILLDKGLAYEKDGAVYIKVPREQDIYFQDLLRQKITFNTRELTDFVIIKSDGFPAFHFAVVVDDATMGITHIIRGEDHISNTPKQILIYQALGYDIPLYAHLPLIVGPDHTPLSKRHGDTALSEFIRQGFIAPALLNFLARMGWGYKNQELFTAQELYELFDIKKTSKSPAVFDLAKLKWLNAQHLKNLAPESIYELLKLDRTADAEKILKLIRVMHPKLTDIRDIHNALSYILDDQFPYELETVATHLLTDTADQLLQDLASLLEATEIWNGSIIEQTIRNYASLTNVKAAVPIHALRAALTGQSVTPGLFELMEILGKKTTLARLNAQRWKKL